MGTNGIPPKTKSLVWWQDWKNMGRQGFNGHSWTQLVYFLRVSQTRKVFNERQIILISVVSWIISPQDVYVLIPRTCDRYHTWQKELSDVIMLRILRKEIRKTKGDVMTVAEAGMMQKGTQECVEGDTSQGLYVATRSWKWLGNKLSSQSLQKDWILLKP